MNIEGLNQEYIDDAEVEESKKIIKKCEDRIRYEKVKIHKREIIVEALLSFLNSTPRKSEGKWVVDDSVQYNTVNGELSDSKLTNMSYLLAVSSSCGISYEVW
jgi:hypothetical protein